MKPFESFLASKLEDYVAYRKAIGCNDKKLRQLLAPFDQYVIDKASSWASFQPTFFLEFRQHLKDGPCSVNRKLSAVRGFFQYLLRRGYYETNPVQDIPPKRPYAYIPFIFSADQTETMLCSIQKRLRKSPQYFFQDLTDYIAIVLLARCGMRISEPLQLLLSHYRSKEQTIYIEKTKFNKDRLIPLPKAAIDEIHNYLAVRNSVISSDENRYLLAGQAGRPVTKHRVYRVFHQAVKDIGCNSPKRIVANTVFGSPTPHCLRHAFAINTLKRIRQRGGCPQHALPVLAAYMGHRKYRYTAVYLKLLDAQQHQGLVDFSIGVQQDI